jgi:hypothetical protein
MIRFILALFLIVNLTYGQKFAKHKLPFHANINGQSISYDLFTVFLIKGEKIDIKVENGEGVFDVLANSGQLKKVSSGEWQFIPDNAAKEGFVLLKNAAETMKIQYLILTPFSKVKNGMIDGYKIGSYPKKALRGNRMYNRPKGFIKVTQENKDLLLTPHFRLGQFLCKQHASFPKYVVLREALLFKLEYILDKINQSSYKANTLFVMSGYRTPYYNKKIGNVKYSRHVYGDAADIFVDENKDGRADDLNGDGKVGFADVMVLYNIVEKMESEKEYKSYIGGMGKYKKNRSHPGFIHTDVRGYRARW